jgi:hypothetical protein
MLHKKKKKSISPSVLSDEHAIDQSNIQLLIESI